jgi:hypothetical protein
MSTVPSSPDHPTEETVLSRARAPDWTEEELVSLLEAVQVHGNDWKAIRTDPNFSNRFHSVRTISSLKTKWFTIKNVPGFKLKTADFAKFAKRMTSSRSVRSKTVQREVNTQG